MGKARARTIDLVVLSAALIGIVAVIWMGPLMMDQLVFFADRDQTRQAAASRQAMLPAAAALLVSAAGLLARHHRWHALLAALPALVAVPLALITPDAAYQLMAYAITAPISLGALLSAAVPPPGNVRIPVLLLGLAVLAALTVLASPATLMILIALIVWWRLPPEGRPEGGPQASAVD